MKCSDVVAFSIANHTPANHARRAAISIRAIPAIYDSRSNDKSPNEQLFSFKRFFNAPRFRRRTVAVI